MWSLFTRTIKDAKLSIIIYFLVILGLAWMYIGLFPSITQNSSVDINALMQAYPPELFEAFGIEGNMFGSIEAFLTAEQFSIMWPILTVAFSVSLSSWAIAGQIEKRTIFYLLSEPISRTGLFFSKYLAGFAISILFSAVTVYPIYWMAKAYDLAVMPIGNYHKLFLLCILFFLTIFSMGMFFSSMVSEKGKVIFYSTGIIVAMYVVDIVSKLRDNLQNIRYSSYFYYFNTGGVLLGKNPVDYAYFVFGGSIILFTLLAWLIFNKRDLTN